MPAKQNKHERHNKITNLSVIFPIVAVTTSHRCDLIARTWYSFIDCKQFVASRTQWTCVLNVLKELFSDPLLNCQSVFSELLKSSGHNIINKKNMSLHRHSSSNMFPCGCPMEGTVNTYWISMSLYSDCTLSLLGGSSSLFCFANETAFLIFLQTACPHPWIMWRHLVWETVNPLMPLVEKEFAD